MADVQEQEEVYEPTPEVEAPLNEAAYSVNIALPKTGQFDKSSMITVRANTQAALIERLDGLPDIVAAYNVALEASGAVQAVQATFPSQPASEAQEGAQTAETANGVHQLCPVHNIPKDKWVPGGFSQKLQRNYQGFWACPVPGCKGK